MQKPDTDYAALYDAAYYQGKGADPLVDYEFELEHPVQTIRRLEWSGIKRAIGDLKSLGPGTKWLDYGCGNGGLVRHLRATNVDAIGYEQGAIAEKARGFGIPIFSDLDSVQSCGPYDVITAIEVLEHLDSPVQTLKEIAGLLAPNGLFFYTTGNLAKHRGKLADWGYVIPEVHISFYEPRTMWRLLQIAGLAGQPLRWSPALADIVRYKVLKNLKSRRMRAAHELFPWAIGTYIANRRYGVFDFPIGIKGAQ